MNSNFLKELMKLILILAAGLLISFTLSKITGMQFRWWITVGIFTGGYIGSQLVKKRKIR